MPHKKRKTPTCLNCGFVFQHAENFCPECGQENDDKRKSLLNFLKDFWDDILQIDNNFIRSIIPFLFKPGKLTNEYNEGRRRHYVTPIRLYLVFSFLYFLLISFEIKKNTSSENAKFPIQFDDENLTINDLTTDSMLIVQLNSSLKTKFLSKKDSLKIIRKIKKIEKKIKAKPDTGKVELFQARRGGLNIKLDDLKHINQLAKIKGITEDRIMDTLGIQKTFFQRLVVRQIVRLGNATKDEVQSSIVEKIPISMFFLLPIFALFLKIIYFRSKRLYIDHLIFTFHIHSFYFFMFTLVMVVAELRGAWEKELMGVSSLFLLFYTYKAFRNVYHQNRFKTLVKFSILGFIYITTLSIFLLLTVFAGLIFF